LKRPAQQPFALRGTGREGTPCTAPFDTAPSSNATMAEPSNAMIVSGVQRRESTRGIVLLKSIDGKACRN
jgi:hypothetical protein